MRKWAALLVLMSFFMSACSIYYHQGKHGRGGVVITVPEKPEVKPMPDEKKNTKHNSS